MSDQFPLVINFQGDYGMKLLLVDPQSTIDQVAAKARDTLVGIVVRPLPEGATLKVRRHGDASVLDGNMKVADAGFVKMEALDIVHSS
ncbi:toluene-4-monooxygenase system B family protein [Hyphomicrobium sp. MC1]|uniref:toluene-4-monooxygenase system B family protein n=1 Tax=Hyphomicrobium sp. (strain MC1) TaxID=717785 RepID=UPI000213EF99|nr:toluene-4-monooxygenase system B family protein [Hyphomicrobium sp. MC1]CCB65465.1 putative BmoB protein [Hyphomicrobium sp. MC1]